MGLTMIIKLTLIAAVFMSQIQVCDAANYAPQKRYNADTEELPRKVRQRQGEYCFNISNGVHNTEFNHYEPYPYDFNIFNREELKCCTNKFKEIWSDYSRSSEQGLSDVPQNIFSMLFKFIDQLYQTILAYPEFDAPYLALGHLLEINAIPLREGQDPRTLSIQAFLCAARNGLPEARYEASRLLFSRGNREDFVYSSLLLSPNDDREKLHNFEESSCAEFISNFVYAKRDSTVQIAPLVQEVSVASHVQNKEIAHFLTSENNEGDERKVAIILIDHNRRGVSLASQVQNYEIANSLIIDLDSDAYDSDGNFLFGIRYDAMPEADESHESKNINIKKLNDSIKIDAYRGDAAGPLNLEKEMQRTKSKFKPRVNSEKPNQYKLSSKRWRTTAVYSTTIGFSAVDRTPEMIQNKAKAIEEFLPYLEEMTKLFESYWPGPYALHLAQTVGVKKIFAGTPFSHFTLNAHEIKSNGQVKKNTPSGIHRDRNDKKSMTLMFVVKSNTQGGDLYFPEYGPQGTVINLRHNALMCFRGALLAHGVTNISRQDKTRSSLRITGVAYLKKNYK